MNEATSRLKINRLLERAGWRFFPENGKPANVLLENLATLKQSDLDGLGDDFEKSERGFIDFLLLDSRSHPLIVLEAKSEGKQPLVGKEQARKYARSKNCRFVILSNGNLHYFWDLDRGNPHIITSFPQPESVVEYKKVSPDTKRLVDETVETNYIVLSQRPQYASEAGWKNEIEQPAFIRANKLRFLRSYQLQAIRALQEAVRGGNDRFLFEMATGTGKTLTAAAIIKLFLRSANASRVLFLVDRLELEKQADKALKDVLSADYTTVIYKEKREDWRSADIVVTTVQSLLFNNKYQDLFSPTDFDLVISDEAHRSISGNARSVFDYFVGYKLGLTATPRDYFRGLNQKSPNIYDPREVERRQFLDTYRTFGCEGGQPTFRYSLLDGVKDGYLISPTVVDARTDITTQLLADEGFTVAFTDESGDDREETFKQRQFERAFFSDGTNQLFCTTFLQNALRDPISGEIGKSIVFSVSQNHAARLANTMNEVAHLMFPGKYESDFAVQVTSLVPDAQLFTVNFANNILMGSRNFLPEYRTSKARVCVTVGMMTTGYDCTDILNIGLFRPIYSPTDFVQIKGRGTRMHDFREELADKTIAEDVVHPNKTTFKLFDFFANCEYFETEFNYDQVLKLPPMGSGRAIEGSTQGEQPTLFGGYEHLGEDYLHTIGEEAIGPEGMKIDRMLFDRFAHTVRNDEAIRSAVEAGEWDRVIDYVNREVFDKPEEYYNMQKLRKAAAVDRRVTLREILEKVFSLIPSFKNRDQLLEEEFAKFLADREPSNAASIPVLNAYFKAYATDPWFRSIIDRRRYQDLATYQGFPLASYRAVPERYRQTIPEYIKDYVSLNQFAP